MADRQGQVLDRARRELGLSRGELWFRYFDLGGNHPVPYHSLAIARSGAVCSSGWNGTGQLCGATTTGSDARVELTSPEATQR